MAEQGAVGLAHRLAALLALRVVGLGQRDRDDAVLVPGHDLLALGVREVGEKAEDERLVGPAEVGRLHEPEPIEPVEEPVLGHLDLAPGEVIAGDVQFGDRLVVFAGGAKGLARAGIDQPVADIVLRVGAEAERTPLQAERGPGVAGAVGRRLERVQVALVRLRSQARGLQRSQRTFSKNRICPQDWQEKRRIISSISTRPRQRPQMTKATMLWPPSHPLATVRHSSSSRQNQRRAAFFRARRLCVDVASILGSRRRADQTKGRNSKLPCIGRTIRSAF